ncbi:MAG: tetratricopeptide repeat protein [Phycisphaerales bacterium]
MLERRRHVFGPDHERVGITLNNLADSLRARGAFEEAAQLFDEAIAIFKLNPGDPSLRLAITMHNAGVMHLEQSQLQRALPMLQSAAEMSASLLPENHWIPAQFKVKWAECLLDQGDLVSAHEMLTRSRPVLVAALGDTHRRVAHIDSLLERIEQ